MNEFFPIEQKMNKFVPYKNDYGIYTALSYTAENIPAGYRLIKIILRNHIQVGRIEITMLKNNLTTN